MLNLFLRALTPARIRKMTDEDLLERIDAVQDAIWCEGWEYDISEYENEFDLLNQELERR